MPYGKAWVAQHHHLTSSTDNVVAEQRFSTTGPESSATAHPVHQSPAPHPLDELLVLQKQSWVTLMCEGGVLCRARPRQPDSSDASCQYQVTFAYVQWAHGSVRHLNQHAESLKTVRSREVARYSEPEKLVPRLRQRHSLRGRPAREVRRAIRVPVGSAGVELRQPHSSLRLSR